MLGSFGTEIRWQRSSDDGNPAAAEGQQPGGSVQWWG
jgi:hypothetical protein